MEEELQAIRFIQLIVLIAILFPMGNILKKAGYNPWLVLLGIIPLVNLVLFLVFAFSTWPRQRAKNVNLAQTFE